jgi:hypothetical protein
MRLNLPRRPLARTLRIGLARYDGVRCLASALVVAESRRLGAYIEGKGRRAADPVAFMVENGGVEALNSAYGGPSF